VTENRAARIARIRTDVRAGAYEPDADAVVEALLGWVAPPRAFERAAPSCGPLDGRPDGLHTAEDADPRR
jgi:hypothetical protein